MPDKREIPEDAVVVVPVDLFRDIMIVVVISLQRWLVPWLVGAIVAAIVVCAVTAVVLDALGVGRAVAERDRAMRDEDGLR